MATYNVRAGSVWHSSPSMKIWTGSQWQDAQGNIWTGRGWDVFTKKYFTRLSNAIITSSIPTIVEGDVTFNSHDGFFYHLTNTNTSYTVRKINRKTGSQVYSRANSNYYQTVTGIGMDETHMYAVSYEYIYKIRLSDGVEVLKVAKAAPSVTAFEKIYTNSYHSYFYSNGIAYNKNNLTKHRDLAVKGTGRVYPFDNSSRVITVSTSPYLTIHCLDNNGASEAWNQRYMGYTLRDLVIKNDYIYLLLVVANQLRSEARLVKLTSSGQEVFSKFLVIYTYAESIRGVVAADASNNCYVMFDGKVEKYDPSGNRMYMYELPDTIMDSTSNLRGLYHYQNEITLWTEHHDRTYAEVFGDV